MLEAGAEKHVAFFLKKFFKWSRGGEERKVFWSSALKIKPTVKGGQGKHLVRLSSFLYHKGR